MRRVLVLGAVAILAVVVPPPPQPLLLWNATASAPLGLYRIVSARQVRPGELVAVHPPDALASWLDARGYAPLGVLLVKRVAAITPSVVCRWGAAVTVDGGPVGLALPRGRRGDPLPRWSGCRRLRPDDIFLLNVAPGSLDSRYFGPLPRGSVVGRALPLWTEGKR